MQRERQLAVLRQQDAAPEGAWPCEISSPVLDGCSATTARALLMPALIEYLVPSFVDVSQRTKTGVYKSQSVE